MRPAVLCSIQAYEYDQLSLPVYKLAAFASDSTLVCADAAYALEWCILDCRLCRSRMRHVHESQSLHNHRSAYALHRSRHLYAYVHLVNLSYRQALSPSHNASCNSLASCLCSVIPHSALFSIVIAGRISIYVVNKHNNNRRVVTIRYHI